MPVSLLEVLDTATESTAVPVAQHKLRLEVLVPNGQFIVEGDPFRLQQVLVDLITHAAKFTPAGGRIWVKVTSEGNEAVVRVQDNGIGIASDELPRIFDLFTQVDTRASEGGLGIGLALVKDFITLHGGSVQVRSDGIGKGSEFIVRLPLLTSAQPEDPRA